MTIWGTPKESLRPREGAQKARARVVFVLLGVAAILGWLYVLFVSNLFVINEIEVTGLKTMDATTVSREVLDLLDRRAVWRPWSSRHAWFVNHKQLAEDLKSRLFAENVTVDNSHNHILRLIMEERANRLVFHSHQQYMWVDLEGVVTKELSDAERRDAQRRILGQRSMRSDDPPLIHRDLDELIAPGYRVAESKDVKSWIELAITVVKSGVFYRELRPPEASSTVAFVTSEEGYPVIIDTLENVLPQLKTYLTYRKSIPGDLKVSQYVDARIPGRLYIK